MFNDELQNRRTFLLRSGQLALSSTALPFALNLAAIGKAAAFTAPTDYKALICVYMSGGNDYGNTLIPVDTVGYGQYSDIRGPKGGAVGIAIDSSVLGPTKLVPKTPPLDPLNAGREYALHPAMTGLKSLFDDGHMAVQLNVGPLIEPLSRTELESRSKRRPPALMSHDDQTTLWQSPNSVVSKVGWGGKTNTLMQGVAVNSADGALFTCISVGRGGSLLLSGDNVKYSVDRNNGAIAIAAAPFGLTNVGTALRGGVVDKVTEPGLAVQTIAGGHKLENEYNTTTARAYAAEAAVKAALALTPVGSSTPVTRSSPDKKDMLTINTQRIVFPTDDLGRQLQMVARLINGRSALAGTAPVRQVFFVDIDGFDMHDNLKESHPRRLGSVSDAIAAFYKATEAMALQNNITTFTASDFGRALAYNGTGTDHGWGSHHFVVGGAVDGKKFYGTPPPINVDGFRTGANNTGPYKPECEWHVGDGRLIPTTSVDQYAATLAKWFGVEDTELPTIFPNINNFGVTFKNIPYNKNMGFMG